MSRVSIAARALSDVIGLPISLTIVLLIVVPVLVVLSTILLCYYWIKARRSKRERNRVASKTSQNSISTNGELEMHLTSVEATYRPATAGSQKLTELSTFVSPADRLAMRMGGHEKNLPSEASTLSQYPPATYTPQQSREMPPPAKPSTPVRSRSPVRSQAPPTSPVRPRTAPNTGQRQYSPVDYHRANGYTHRSPSPPETSRYNNPPSPTRSDISNATLPRTHKRSSSLGKPMRPPHRPTHSPAGSVRSLSIFPPKHLPGQQSMLSPAPSQLSYGFPLTPSPPLLSPIPQISRSPPPRTPQHSRHPSIDRNSAMPIAPIILPTELTMQTLPTVPERTYSQEYDGGYPSKDTAYHRDNYI